MFILTLTEQQPPLQLLDPATGEKTQIDNGAFEHFRHQFRELPADKIQQIMAIITKPPRAPRKDRGTTRKKVDTTPPLPGTGE